MRIRQHLLWLVERELLHFIPDVSFRLEWNDFLFFITPQPIRQHLYHKDTLHFVEMFYMFIILQLRAFLVGQV